MKQSIILSIIFGIWAFFPRFGKEVVAQPSEIQILRNEVRELRKTVEQLTHTVHSQNRKIAPTVAAPETPAAPHQAEPQIAETLESTPKPTETRNMGFWKVPVQRSGAWKLIPDISVIGIFAAAYFSQDPGPSGHDPSRTGFNLQEIEIAFQSIVDPYIRADVFLSFLEEGVELEEAYITTLSLPKGFQIKGGKYLLAFGRQNPKHVDQWPFVNNNLPNRFFFGDEGFNELGLELSYLFPFPFFLQTQFSFTQGSNEGNFDGNGKGDFAYTGRLSASADLTENLTALMGSSVAFGHNNTGQGNNTTILGGDFLLKWKPSPYRGVEWQSEYIYRRRQVPGGLEAEGGISSYILGNWSKRWGAGLRADYIGIPAETDKIFRLSPMVAFRLTEFFRLKAQYDLIAAAGDKVQQAAMLQMIFNMGPHGAHQF